MVSFFTFYVIVPRCVSSYRNTTNKQNENILMITVCVRVRTKIDAYKSEMMRR